MDYSIPENGIRPVSGISMFLANMYCIVGYCINKKKRHDFWPLGSVLVRFHFFMISKLIETATENVVLLRFPNN